jgi:hypothetical protein
MRRAHFTLSNAWRCPPCSTARHCCCTRPTITLSAAAIARLNTPAGARRVSRFVEPAICPDQANSAARQANGTALSLCPATSPSGAATSPCAAAPSPYVTRHLSQWLPPHLFANLPYSAASATAATGKLTYRLGLLLSGLDLAGPGALGLVPVHQRFHTPFKAHLRLPTQYLAGA